MSAMLLISAHADFYEMDDLVVTPQPDNLDLMNGHPASDVTVIDRDTIVESGAISLPEVLQRDANILVRGTTGTGLDGQLSMRGFGENSNLRTLILVDGHKLNRPDMGGIEWWTLPVMNIERIEVIRGGQGVLYGNHAVSGVINITTRRAGEAGTQLNGTMGSFGYLGGDAAFGAPVGNVDLLGGISGFRTDGYRTNSAAKGQTINGSAAWYMNDTDVLTFRAMAGEADAEYPGPLSYDEMKEDPTQSNNGGDQYSNNRIGQTTLIYEADRDDHGFRTSFGLNRRELDGSISGIESVMDQTGVSLEARGRLGTVDSFVMAGAELFYDMLYRDNYWNADREVVTSFADHKRLTASPFIYAQKTAGKNVFSGGARYEYAGTDYQFTDYFLFPGNPPTPVGINPLTSYDEYLDQDGWAGELSWARYLSNDWKVFAGYDRVYRYPSLDESASYQGFPLSDPLNENLDPEKGNNYEIGTRFENKSWTVSLTAFFMDLENEIAFYSNNGTNLNVNIGPTHRYGLEPEVIWDGGSFGWATRWSLVDAQFSGGVYEGSDVPLVPDFYGNVSVWVEPAERLRLTLSYIYVSEQYQGNDFENMLDKMEAYGLLGLRANIKLTDYADMTISMDNLLDEIYAPVAYSDAYYPGTGRSFRAGLRMAF